MYARFQCTTANTYTNIATISKAPAANQKLPIRTAAASYACHSTTKPIVFEARIIVEKFMPTISITRGAEQRSVVRCTHFARRVCKHVICAVCLCAHDDGTRNAFEHVFINPLNSTRAAELPHRRDENSMKYGYCVCCAGSLGSACRVEGNCTRLRQQRHNSPDTTATTSISIKKCCSERRICTHLKHISHDCVIVERTAMTEWTKPNTIR